MLIVCIFEQETNETHTPLNHLAKSCIPSLPKSVISTAPDVQVRVHTKTTQMCRVAWCRVPQKASAIAHK